MYCRLKNTLYICSDSIQVYHAKHKIENAVG